MQRRYVRGQGRLGYSPQDNTSERVTRYAFPSSLASPLPAQPSLLLLALTHYTLTLHLSSPLRFLFLISPFFLFSPLFWSSLVPLPTIIHHHSDSSLTIISSLRFPSLLPLSIIHLPLIHLPYNLSFPLSLLTPYSPYTHFIIFTTCYFALVTFSPFLLHLPFTFIHFQTGFFVAPTCLKFLLGN